MLLLICGLLLFPLACHPHMYTHTAHTTTATWGVCPGRMYGLYPRPPTEQQFCAIERGAQTVAPCVPAAVVGGVRRWQELQGVLLRDK